MKLVSVIIVNWNGKHFLKNCLSTLYKQAYKHFEVILVDNASSDGSVLYVKNHFPKIIIIQNEKNLGFAEGNNIGYQKAKGTYILFLNNDTTVTDSFLTGLVSILEKDISIGGVQSKILLMDKPSTLDSIGAFMTPTGFLYHYGFGKKDIKKYDKEISLFTAKGACMLFRKEVLTRCLVDGDVFDADFFAYFEETDLCHRVWLSGYRIEYTPSSVIYHKMGGTSEHIHNSIIQYHSYKNRICSYIKNLGVRWLWAILPVHIALCIVFSFALLLKGQWKIFCAIYRAFYWNIRHIQGTLLKRAYVQNHIRRIPDHNLTEIMYKPKLSYYIHTFRGDITGYEE